MCMAFHSKLSKFDVIYMIKQRVPSSFVCLIVTTHLKSNLYYAKIGWLDSKSTPSREVRCSIHGTPIWDSVCGLISLVTRLKLTSSGTLNLYNI